MKQDITHLLSKYGRTLCLGMLTAFAVAACQKDDRTVVLNAVISEQPNSNAKVYVEGNTAYWQHGDKVKVNGTECDVSVTAPSTTTARIINVGAADKYTAGYPSEYTTHVNDGSLKIEIPHDHVYEVANRYDGTGATAQRVVSPMAAYTEDGTTLMFQNVASLLEVEIENESIDHEMTLYAVEVVSDNAPLSGILPVGFDEEGAVTVNPSDASSTQKSVIMHFTGVGSSVVLDKSSGSGTKTAKVYIPILPILEGKKSNLTVHVMATGDDNMKYTFHKTSVTSGGVWIARNAMGSISCKLNSTTCAGENDYFWGKGSPTCPYIIENEADLIRLRNLVNGSSSQDNSYNNSGVYYRQTQNITLSGTTWGKLGDNNPIGISTNGDTYFNANYNGGGHWVNINNTGLTDDDFANNGCVGLFGVAGGGGSIRNLTVKGTLNTVGKNLHVGGVVGRISGAFTIDTCRNEINLTTVNANATQYYGGICGCIQASSSSTVVNINHCINKGDITRDDYGQIGGICGFIMSGKVTFLRDTNTATVSGSSVDNYQYTGGICAACTTSNIDLQYDHCINQGAVEASNDGIYLPRIGGIMGYVGSATTFTDCRNKEITDGSSVINTISGKSYLGGIAGYVFAANTSFESCKNEGKIYGTNDYIGGVIGYVYSTDITLTDCENSGAIEGLGSDIGGLVGHCEKPLTIVGSTSGGTKNSGSITGKNNVGGIVGYTKNARISNAINKATGIITGSGTQNTNYGIGGIIGTLISNNITTTPTFDNKIENCWNMATIESTNSIAAGGIVGRTAQVTINKCKNTGVVLVKNTGSNAGSGGIIGFSNGGSTITISNCGVECSYIGTSSKKASYCGCFVGYGRDSFVIINSYAKVPELYGHTKTSGIIGNAAGNTSNITISTKNTYALFYAKSGTSQTAHTYTASKASYDNSNIVNTYINTNFDGSSAENIRLQKTGKPCFYYLPSSGNTANKNDSDEPVNLDAYGSTTIGDALTYYRTNTLTSGDYLTWTSDAIPTLDWTGIFPASK